VQRPFSRRIRALRRSCMNRLRPGGM